MNSSYLSTWLRHWLITIEGLYMYSFDAGENQIVLFPTYLDPNGKESRLENYPLNLFNYIRNFKRWAETLVLKIIPSLSTEVCGALYVWYHLVLSWLCIVPYNKKNYGWFSQLTLLYCLYFYLSYLMYTSLTISLLLYSCILVIVFC